MIQRWKQLLKLRHSLAPRILPSSPLQARIRSRRDYCCFVGKKWSSSRLRRRTQGHRAINKGRACRALRNMERQRVEQCRAEGLSWGPQNELLSQNWGPQFWAGLVPLVWFWLAPIVLFGMEVGVFCVKPLFSHPLLGQCRPCPAAGNPSVFKFPAGSEGEVPHVVLFIPQRGSICLCRAQPRGVLGPSCWKWGGFLGFFPSWSWLELASDTCNKELLAQVTQAWKGGRCMGIFIKQEHH